MVYINGEYFSKSEAKISIFDRGFLYSDGVYEVVPVVGGQLFLFADHMKRLERSAKSILMKAPELDYLAIARKLISDSQLQDGFLYLQITRGGGLERNHLWKPAEVVPTVVAFCQKVKFAPRLSEYNQLSQVPKDILKSMTLKANAVEDFRWSRCHIKSIALLPNVLARFESAQKGFDEVIFLKNKVLTEGSSTNVFIVKKGVVYTPPLKANILPGVTRGFVLKSLKRLKIKYAEKALSQKDLLSADEVWISSSTKDFLPAVKIDSKKIGKGHPGELWFKAYKKFQELKPEGLV